MVSEQHRSPLKPCPALKCHEAGSWREKALQLVFFLHVNSDRVSTQVAVVVVRELFFSRDDLCADQRSQVRGYEDCLVYHMARVFVYCCVLTTGDMQGPFPLYFAM